MLDRIKDDKGLMGRTHAVSALTVSLLIIAFLPTFMQETILQTDDFLILISSIFVVVGMSMWPDFDNSKSTAISTFGILGVGISKAMRSFAILVYSLVHSRKDDPTPNPHRSFWHTLVSAVFLGFIIILTTSIPGEITLPILDKNVAISFLTAIIWIFVSIKLALAGLFGNEIKKIKNKGIIYQISSNLVALAFSISILIVSPGDLTYRWIAYSAILGYIIHILGDTMTTAGTPLLWPIKHRGKRWWDYRIFGFKAGGTVENLIVFPILVILTLLSCAKIIYTFIQ